VVLKAKVKEEEKERKRRKKPIKTSLPQIGFELSISLSRAEHAIH